MISGRNALPALFGGRCLGIQPAQSSHEDISQSYQISRKSGGFRNILLVFATMALAWFVHKVQRGTSRALLDYSAR